jgi:hypothetical protein
VPAHAHPATSLIRNTGTVFHQATRRSSLPLVLHPLQFMQRAVAARESCARRREDSAALTLHGGLARPLHLLTGKLKGMKLNEDQQTRLVAGAALLQVRRRGTSRPQ